MGSSCSSDDPSYHVSTSYMYTLMSNLNEKKTCCFNVTRTGRAPTPRGEGLFDLWKGGANVNEVCQTPK